LVKEIYTFYLDPTLCNLEVCSSTFIRLNLPTQLAKTVKIEASLSNDVSLTFSSLSLNDVSFMVFNLGLTNFNWVHVLSISFNCTHNCLQKFNFKHVTHVKLNYQPLSWFFFHFDLWLWIYTFWLLIDQQIFIFSIWSLIWLISTPSFTCFVQFGLWF
jgi:hypothetical protein